jgi:acyl carrier protein
VARGYLNHPEQMASELGDDITEGDLAGGFYRTGDLARRLPNGVVEFLGRDDDQVKIRGFRVELGEIEAVLGDFPGVAERCVLLRNAAGDRPELVAYLSPEPDGQLPVAELGDFLRARLPEVMVPAAYVMLDALPRTAHGKIDRAALPPPDPQARLARGPRVAPRSPEEETIAAIWQEVLGLEHVGVHDNFFQLGGHSLLATLIITRVERAFGVKVRVRTLFDQPTVAEIASEVKNLAAGGEGEGQESDASITPIRRLSPEERAALSRATWTASQPDAGQEA